MYPYERVGSYMSRMSHIGTGVVHICIRVREVASHRGGRIVLQSNNSNHPPFVLNTGDDGGDDECVLDYVLMRPH